MLRKFFVVLWISFFFIACNVCIAADKKNVISTTPHLKQNVTPPVQIVTQDIAIENIYVDTQCRIWVRWKNKGNVKIDKILKEEVFVVGTSLKSYSANHVVLEPGAVFAHGVGENPGMKLSGPSTVTASIGTQNDFPEKNKQNNSMTKTLTCGNRKALPDLITTDLNCKTLQTTVDSQNRLCRILEISVTIKNIGTRDITTPFKVLLENDSGINRSFVSMGIWDVPALAAGVELTPDSTRQTDTCFWYVKNPTMWEYSPRGFRVRVDSENAVFESIEKNNLTTLPCNFY
jgi:hypothetical protein